MKRTILKLCILSAVLLCATSGFAQHYNIQLQSGSFVPQQVVNREFSNTEVVDGKYYRYIQFHAIPTDTERAEFAMQGLELLAYIPDNAYLAAIPVDNTTVLNNSNIRAVLPIIPHYKLSKDLIIEKYPDELKRSGNKIELAIQYMPGLHADAIAAFLQHRGVEIEHSIPKAHSFRVVMNISDISQIASLPYISSIELAPGEPVAENLVGRTNHRSNALATDYKTGLKFDGTGVEVALNDDGIIGPHIDYEGRITDTYIGFDNGNHGDHCAGIIFGAGNKDPIARGMAFGANLGVYGVDGMFPTAFQAFDSIDNHYVSKGVRITSTSYGDITNGDYTWLSSLLDEQINNMPQLMHVFSAGNSGSADLGYGAGAGWGNITGGHKQAKNLIAVGNLSSTDVLAGSSSRGPAYDGRIKPEICAVGTNVYSTMDINDYQVQSGTSMACPGVAGTLAQLYQAYKSTHSGQNPESALIKAAVLNTGDDLGNPGPDYRFGWGRINARRAYDLINSNQYLTAQVSQGGTNTHTINVPAGTAELRVMVYWHDKEANANVAKALVNNLNMSITTPSSAQVLPWILNPTPSAALLNANAVQGVDTLNNAEQVTITNPAAGNYTVSINGFAIPFGPQKYYVVYEFVQPTVTLTYPIGGESIVPGVQEIIRWDASTAATLFTLEYTTNGSTWNLLANNISATTRSYTWTPPNIVSGKARVRITRGLATDMSDTNFSIIPVPTNLTVDWVCADSLQVSYTAVSGATGYIVTVLGQKYMDSSSSSTTTTCVAHGINTTQPGWVSIQATGPDNCIGRRAMAIPYSSVPFNCTVPEDIAATKGLLPTTTELLECQNASFATQVAFELKNFSLTTKSNIPVKFSIDGATPVSGTFTGSIAPQATATHTFPGTVTMGPGTHQFKAWTEFVGDGIPTNDTITWTKTITTSSAVSLPIMQDIESWASCNTTANCEQTTCVLADQWVNAANDIDDDIDWRVHSGPTPSNAASIATGPATDYKPGTATGKYLYLESTNCYGKRADLVSPCIDLNGIGHPMLYFGYHMYGAAMGELHLDVKADGVWTNDVMPVLSGDKGNSWKIASVVLDAYKNKIINIRFRGITGDAETSDMAIDGINLYDATAVNDVHATTEVRVYPNPSDGVYNVQLSNIATGTELVVTDVTGKVIRQIPVTASQKNTILQLQLSDVPAGVYILSVKDKSYTRNIKLVRL